MAVMQEVKQLPGYQRHITSEFLADRYPYLEDINGHLKADQVSMAKGDRLFPRLVEQLQSPGMAPEVLVEALCTVCDMCSNQEQKCTAICSDVIAACTNLLMHESIPVRRDAARVIGSLALLMGGRSLLPVGNTAMARDLTKAVGSGPTLPRLAKLLLSCDDELVKMNVAATFKAVTIFRDGCQQVVDQGSVKSIAQYLCATLPDQPATKPLALCLLYLLQTLAAVTMYARDGVRDVFNCGLLDKVIRFLEFVPPDGRVVVAPPAESCEIVRQCLRFLWHCGNDQQGRREALKAEGVRVITRYLADKDQKAREAAICALNVVALETQGRKDLLEHSLEAMTNLLHSIKETHYLQEACVQLVRGASELPAFRFAFARRVLSSIWLLEKVYGTTALAAISPLLGPKEDAGTRTQAAKVTGHFLALKGEAQKGDDIRVPPVSPLESIEEPALYAMAECVDILHNLLEILEVSRAPALLCLDILTNFNRPREELRRVLASGRARAPEDAMPEIERMLAKTSAK
mmetsp:Transcript_22568/g.59602  ORF Transcript_22568/g.59602 Transcript_22568/m.59602 type:complete len:519 (-) Transcript_22568:52-1608(-)